jgi:hypothetical protein
MSDQVNTEVEEFKRKLLSERLAQCTEKQVAFFNRIFPDGVPEDKLVSAIDLCDRTIAKNKSDPARLAPPPDADEHGNN